MIDNYIHYILNDEFRLADGTLARNRPLPNTLWLDDLYMSLPALAQMGKLTGEARYFDEAIRQFWLFADRMFVPQKGLYRSEEHTSALQSLMRISYAVFCL